MNRRSLVIRLVFGLTATALLVSVFMLYEESFLQRLSLRTKSSSTTTTTVAASSSSSLTTRSAPILQQQQQQQALEGRRQDESSSSSFFSSSFLNVRPIGLNRCTTVRFRSNKNNDESSYTVEEAMDILRQRQQQRQKSINTPPLRVGLVFVENPTDFVSLSKGVFHLFHFLEFLVVAYTELHRLQAAAAAMAFTPDSTFHVTAAAVMNNNHNNTKALSAAATLQAVQVPWLYVPLLTRQEICGTAQGMNCLILQMVLTATIPTPPPQQQSLSSSSPRQVDIFGVESNDNITRQVHEAFTGIWPKRKQDQSQPTTGMMIPVHEDDALGQAALHQWSSSSSISFSQQQQNADLVLLIDRHSCKRQQQQRIQKMWTNYIADNNNNINSSDDDDNNVSSNNNNNNNDNVVWQRPSRRFPAELWHADVMTALGDTLYPPPGIVATKAHEDTQPALRRVVTVCYIDRQGTSRRLPDTFHDWLVGYLESQHHEQKIDFVHLHMENYSALDQIRLAASCRVLLGVHGNGLSNVAWMKPPPPSSSSSSSVSSVGAVVEFFFDYPFYYDYATLSQLFRLRYFVLWNGHVLDAQRIAQRNVTILKETRSVLLDDNNNKNNNSNKNQTKYSFTQESQANPAAIAKRLQVAQAALQDFLESTLLQ